MLQSFQLNLSANSPCDYTIVDDSCYGGISVQKYQNEFKPCASRPQTRLGVTLSSAEPTQETNSWTRTHGAIVAGLKAAIRADKESLFSSYIKNQHTPPDSPFMAIDSDNGKYAPECR